MSEVREMRQRCKMHKMIIKWNKKNRSRERTMRETSDDENGGNQERANE